MAISSNHAVLANRPVSGSTETLAIPVSYRAQRGPRTEFRPFSRVLRLQSPASLCAQNSVSRTHEIERPKPRPSAFLMMTWRIGGAYVHDRKPDHLGVPKHVASEPKSDTAGAYSQQGGAFQWVQAPPGSRSSRKQPEQSWR